MSSIFNYWTLPILWAGMISLFSTSGFSADQTSPFILPFFNWMFPQGTPEFFESLHFVVRKLGHWVEYFVLALLVYRAFQQGRTPRWQWRWAVWTLGVIFAYSVTDEIHQAFVPGREASAQDSLLDSLGGSCAVALLYLRHRMRLDSLLTTAEAADESLRQR